MTKRYKSLSTVFI